MSKTRAIIAFRSRPSPRCTRKKSFSTGPSSTSVCARRSGTHTMRKTQGSDRAGRGSPRAELGGHVLADRECGREPGALEPVEADEAWQTVRLGAMNGKIRSRLAFAVELRPNTRVVRV